jgi:hypothetical protein
VPIPSREDRALYQQVLAQHGGPAYLRRAHQVEDVLQQLLARSRQQRSEWLQIVRINLGTLLALAGDWSVLRSLLADDDQLQLLQALHAELQPELRCPPEPTSSVRALGRQLAELCDGIKSFNQRWQAYLPGVDLSEVNQVRENYNRWYVLEKECAVRSPRIARQGFRPLPPLTHAELAALLPLLPVPRLKV